MKQLFITFYKADKNKPQIEDDSIYSEVVVGVSDGECFNVVYDFVNKEYLESDSLESVDIDYWFYKPMELKKEAKP